jgi:hypothetical protein
MYIGSIFRSLFLSAAETNFSALPSKIFDKVDKIEKGVNGDLATALENLEQNSGLLDP